MKLVSGSWNCSTSLNIIVSQHNLFVPPLVSEDVAHDSSSSKATTGITLVMINRSWSLDISRISSIDLGPMLAKPDR